MVVKISKNIVKEIARSVRDFGMTPVDIQRTYGISYTDIEELITSGELPVMGDPSLYEHIISIKQRGGLWPAQHDSDIRRAKESCDRGTTNLTYGYTPTHLVMYSIPRKYKEFRKPWFFGEINGGGL